MKCEHGTENCLGSGEKHHCHVPTIEQLLQECVENRSILRSVNGALNDAGIYCAITFAEAIRQIAQDRDKYRDLYTVEDKQLLRVCVDFRIKELNEAVDMCLRRGMGSHLRHLNLTGREAESELRWLRRLRDKLS